MAHPFCLTMTELMMKYPPGHTERRNGYPVAVCGYGIDAVGDGVVIFKEPWGSSEYCYSSRAGGLCAAAHPVTTLVEVP